MAEVTNLSSSNQNVKQKQTFILTASVLGGPDRIRFTIPSAAPVVFTNNNSKCIEESAPKTGHQEVKISVSLNGQPGYFDIIASPIQNLKKKSRVAMHLIK